MNLFQSAARDILNRCPAPAMTLAEFLVALERDYPEHRADGPAVLRALEHADGIRILRRPASAQAAGLGPVAWLVAHRRDPDEPIDPCLATRRLRASVVALGSVAETEALASWARWSHVAFRAAVACSSRASRRPTERPSGRRWSDPRSPAVTKR